MFALNDTLLSEGLFHTLLALNRKVCKLAHCFEAGSDAPLHEKEVECFEETFGVAKGIFRFDDLAGDKGWLLKANRQGNYGACLVDGRADVFAKIAKDSALKHSLDMAWQEKKPDGSEPISCRFNSDRSKGMHELDPLHLHSWMIGHGVRACDDKENITVLDLYKTALMCQFDETCQGPGQAN